MKNVLCLMGGIIVLLLFPLIHSCKKEKPAPPVVTTTEATLISYITATAGGNVTGDGGASVISKGICWSTSSGPTTSDLKTVESEGSGAFTSNLTQLSPNTFYYVRAYATNSAGTGYGNEVTFTTSQLAVPVLTTDDIASIAETTATSGGNITDEKGTPVTERGVCWSTSQNPTTSDTHISNGTGIGVFESSLTGLTGSTTYYVRAYASNSVGTSYGDQVSFTTAQITPPTLTTVSITAVTVNTAISGGEITSESDSPLTARGVCWSTGQNPTIADKKSSDGTGTGIFTSRLTGLTPGTTYYVRAYATNSTEIYYGSELSFATFTPITDIDGNLYNIVAIGSQVWMAENLKTTRYNDGTAIPEITNNTEWAALSTGAFCNYNNSAENNTVYGRMYNWYVVDNYTASKVASNGGKNVCPTGWHVPADSEWITLTDYLITNGYNWDGTNTGDNIAKSLASTTGWSIDATPGYVGNDQTSNNRSGFTALPGGYRQSSGGYNTIGKSGFWWSTTIYPNLEKHAWDRAMSFMLSVIDRGADLFTRGHSVRCLKD